MSARPAWLPVLLTICLICVADPVDFGRREYVLCGSHRLDVGTYSAPCVTDWDCDGKQDLLVGQFESGRIRFYHNEGEHGAPVFTTFGYLMDGSVPLSVPWG